MKLMHQILAHRVSQYYNQYDNTAPWYVWSRPRYW